MIFGLKEEELRDIDKDAVRKMIADNEQRLDIWSIPNYEKEKIRNEIEELKKLLEV